MVIYKAYLKQTGEGCDQTIGCAEKMIDLKSTNLIDAANEIAEIIKEEYSEGNDTELESCELYEVSRAITIDLKGIYEKKVEKREPGLYWVVYDKETTIAEYMRKCGSEYWLVPGCDERLETEEMDEIHEMVERR